MREIVNLAAFRAEGYWLELAMRAHEDGSPGLARKLERAAKWWRVRIEALPARPIPERAIRRHLRDLGVAHVDRGPIRFTLEEAS